MILFNHGALNTLIVNTHKYMEAMIIYYTLHLDYEKEKERKRCIKITAVNITTISFIVIWSYSTKAHLIAKAKTWGHCIIVKVIEVVK